MTNIRRSQNLYFQNNICTNFALLKIIKFYNEKNCRFCILNGVLFQLWSAERSTEKSGDHWIYECRKSLGHHCLSRLY